MTQLVPPQSSNSNVHRTQIATQFNSLIKNINSMFGAPAGASGRPALTAHAVLVGEGIAQINPVGPASAGKILVAKGASADPAFVNGASVQSTLGNSSTASTSGAMLGYGATIALTPTYSGKVLVTFNGLISNNTASAIGVAQIHYGTGTAPSSGGALVGLAPGDIIGIVNNADTAGADLPFSVTVLATGLTVGTAYWFDLSMICVGASTTSLLNVYACATEVP